MFWQIVTCLYYILGLGLLLKIYNKVTCGMFRSDKRLDGQVIIVTGANSGIGKEAALDFAKRGAKVILACRNLERGAKARDEIVELTNNKNVVVKQLDLTSLNSVRNFAEEINATENRLDVLVNNAGAGGLGDHKSQDGLQLGMQVNHYAPFLLTNLLIDLLKRSAPSRIVNVSSVLHKMGKVDFENLNFEKGFNDFYVYANNKLFNVICSNEAARRLQGTGVTSNSLHPGVVQTEIFRRMPHVIHFFIQLILSLFCKTAEEGAQTTIFLAVSDDVADVSGKYFSDCKEANPAKVSQDPETARKLWEKCCDLVSLRPEERRI